jgi:hypothetical protein
MSVGGEGLAGLEDVQAHGIVGGVVEDENKKIELHQRVQAFGEFVEKGLEIALLGDGFADLQECVELALGMVERGRKLGFLRKMDRIRHRSENNIGFGGVTTLGSARADIGGCAEGAPG